MIRVLIVDDSAVACQALAREIAQASDLEVVGAAGDPYEARDKIVALRPDVVTLDLEMPRMNGLTFLGKLMRYHPLPVVVVSSHAGVGAAPALQALEIGAVDVLEKPQSALDDGDFGRRLVESLRGAAQSRRPDLALPARHRSQPTEPPPRCFHCQVLAIGASVGGTEALREVLRGLPANTPGLLIAQHLPAAFMGPFAERLRAESALDVRVAQSGDVLQPGLALLAPGDQHMVLHQRAGRCFVDVKAGPPVHYHCPSIDVLFHSVAATAGPAAVGVLLTGMGMDGARGLLAMRRAGACTFAQDEASCVVFGMPKAAIELGAAERVVALTRISHELLGAIAGESPRPTAAPLQEAVL